MKQTAAPDLQLRFNPAFPTDIDQGMSMRDYFAAAAIEGLAERPIGDQACAYVATTAYKLADAMLKERAR
jgi:hypothetical protein